MIDIVADRGPKRNDRSLSLDVGSSTWLPSVFTSGPDKTKWPPIMKKKIEYKEDNPHIYVVLLGKLIQTYGKDKKNI